MHKKFHFSIWYYVAIFGAIVLLEATVFSGNAVKEIPYSQFKNELAANRIESAVIQSSMIYGVLKPTQNVGAAALPAAAASGKQAQGSAPASGFTPVAKATPWSLSFQLAREKRAELLKREFSVVRLTDPTLLPELDAHRVDYRGKLTSNWLQQLFFNWIVPFGILFLVWGFVYRRMAKGGPTALSIGKNKAKIYEADASKRVTFKDVAGIDEAVEEVSELVAFLKEPSRFTKLGAKLPKGLLLVGPPGTGKTLLARAVAGEAGVPFFSMSGSGFVEMFVGVGASRVRDLFQEAKAKAPCIIFIDELDAVGKNRSGAYFGGNDERENTLNQLLTEMDGFEPNAGVIMVGATNRPEVLDPALLRPGRFDRQVLVDRPDLKGRIQIFEVHTRDIVLGEDVDLKRLAASTPGFAGAEIANVCNEAALLASRREGEQVEMADFQNAIERIVAGLEKKNKLINPQERRIVAYHESGHAVVGYLTPGADPVQKVSIVPRGIGALGYTLQTPLEDRYLMSRTELLGKIKGLLGGRAAEEIVFGEVSTGASNDLERVSKIVRDMLTVYGMSRRSPNVSLVDREDARFLGQGPALARRSEKYEEELDDEMREIIRECYDEDKELLRRSRALLDRMAGDLLEREKLDEGEIVAMLGPRPGAALPEAAS